MYEDIRTDVFIDLHNESVAMPRDLKYLNRAKVLTSIRAAESVTVNEVSEATGISRQTVIKSLETFLESGIVVSMGKGNSTHVGGKKPEVFKFNEKYKYNICVRFDGSKIVVALMDLKTNILASEEAPHNKNEKLEVILEDFSRLYKKILGDHGLTEDDIYGTGFCTGGVCELNRKVMRYNVTYPSWGVNIPIGKMVQKYVSPHIVTLFVNDAKMSGLAEIGDDHDLSNRKFVNLSTMDNGITAGFMYNGSVVVGDNSLTGEVGHMILDFLDTEVCQCGNTGCFERLVSLDRARKLAESSKERYKDSALFKLDHEIGMKDIFENADKGDELAVYIVQYLARIFAVAIKNICAVSDPAVITVQGVYSDPGELFRSEVEKHLKTFKFFPENICECIRYSKGDLCHKVLVGLSIALNNHLLRNFVIE